MLKLAENTEINQVSLTGVRALVLLTLLIDAPKTFEEIKQAFIKLKIMEPESSDDIIRININTLRNIGCEITRAGSKTNYKYTLLEHPFAIGFTDDEISVLKRVYNKVKSNSDIELLLKFDELFKKLASCVNDDKTKETLLGLSLLKDFNIDLIKELINDCTKKQILNLIYQKPSENPTEKNVAAQRIVIQNDSIFLYCYDFGRKESIILNIKRILSIISRKNNDSNDIKIETKNIKFFLRNSCILALEENEQIIEEQTDGKVIEGKYYNKFTATQRILSFGSACTVIEPKDFREEIIEILKSMRSIYNG